MNATKYGMMNAIKYAAVLETRLPPSAKSFLGGEAAYFKLTMLPVIRKIGEKVDAI